MFITRFNRVDGSVKDYYYYTEEEAKNHLELFKDDDSGLYSSIDIICVQGDTETPVGILFFR